MKRSSFALALAVWLAPASIAGQDVTTELYGDFRYSYSRADAGDSTHWASANNASRLGVRGEVTAGGLTAFADLQTGVSIDWDPSGSPFTQRYFLAGVRGDFGSLTVGRHSPAYKVAGVRVDPFYDTSTISAGGLVPETGLFGGASFGLSGLTNGWADRALAYTTPSLAGFSANAALYLDTDSDHDYGLGAGYRGDGVDAGVQFFQGGSGRNWGPAGVIDRAARGHVSVARGIWSLGGSYERLESRSDAHQNFLYLSGTVAPLPPLLLALAVGHVDDEAALQPMAGTAVHTGIFYTLLPGARIHALYSHLDAVDEPGRGNLAVGLTYHFAIQGP